MQALELFAGAGGLAMGTARAGFEHVAVFERDPNACETIRRNNARGVVRWPLRAGDARAVDFRPFEGVALLAGGPPCQPFSIGGKHRGQADGRNLFPEAIRAIREARPRAVLLENVKGLLRPAFAPFFEYLLLQIARPEETPRARDDWTSHFARLRASAARGRRRGWSYRVAWRKLNAVDYGVPQKRERVFIVALRSDVAGAWSFPSPTHGREALLRDQWLTGAYWERHGVPRRARPRPSPAIARRLAALGEPDHGRTLAPWRTVRDAIADLPAPGRAGAPTNHRHNPGARAYKGHTGSRMDEPAKTLKAGDHGVPGGENMLAHANGRTRYFTVRECARLQTFPDEFEFAGAWTESMRQLGNAVAVEMARAVARRVREALLAEAG